MNREALVGEYHGAWLTWQLQVYAKPTLFARHSQSLQGGGRLIVNNTLLR